MDKNLLRKIDLLTPFQHGIVNQYKRQDVFRCTHETHAHFNSVVSVYHVLKEKRCYPDGCFYFRWKCQKLNKGEQCPRKYKHVGRDCSSCRHFYDIKVIKKPEIVLPQQAFRQFQNELKAFETWLAGNLGRLVDFSGCINSVKPRYSLREGARRPRVVLEGFLLNFLEGSINARLVRDFIYVPISMGHQKRFHFAKGDCVQGSGFFGVIRGTFILNRIRGIDFDSRGTACFWNESRALVAQKTGAILRHQADKCYACDKGILLENKAAADDSRGTRRRMFCLEGIADPEWCSYPLQKVLDCAACPIEADPSGM